MGTLSTPENKRVDSFAVENTATGSLGGTEPKTDGVESSFVDGESQSIGLT